MEETRTQVLTRTLKKQQRALEMRGRSEVEAAGEALHPRNPPMSRYGTPRMSLSIRSSNLGLPLTVAARS